MRNFVYLCVDFQGEQGIIDFSNRLMVCLTDEGFGKGSEGPKRQIGYKFY